MSTTDDDRSVSDENVEYTSVAGPLLPLVIGQGPHFDKGEKVYHWLLKRQRAPEYLDLLYDIAISSVLSLFTNYHEMLDGSSVLAYFSYFVIIWYVWSSQVIYDTRFQANDWIHRVFKFLQLGSFAYIGVFAQNFDPKFVVYPSDITTTEAVVQVGGADSFKGVGIAYAVSRVLLMSQYIYVIAVTRKEDRRGRLACLLIPVGACFVSGLFWFIAGLDSGNAASKLGLAYTGLGLEVAATALTWLLPNPIQPSSSLMSERFADLTIIILAEGVMGIVQTLGGVVSGWGLNAGQSGLNGYSECFCSLLIVFATWHFLFHAFDPEARFKSHKVGIIWAVLHIPLHFVILLLLCGMRNVAVFGNIYGALTEFNTICNDTINEILVVGGPVSLSQLLSPNVVLQMNKLQQLSPGFTDEMNNIATQIGLIENNTTPTSNPSVAILQYSGQVWMNVAEAYGITPTNETQALYNILSNDSTAWGSDNGTATFNTASNDWTSFSTEYLVDLIRSSLFFLPCAGGLIIMSVILTVFRTRNSSTALEIKGHEEERHERLMEDGRGKSEKSSVTHDTGKGKLEKSGVAHGAVVRSNKSFSDLWSLIPLGAHFGVGVGLCLLGFLDIGDIVNGTPEETLLASGWALPTAAISFAALIVMDFASLAIHRVVKGGGWKTHHVTSAAPPADDADVIEIGPAAQTTALPAVPALTYRPQPDAPGTPSHDVQAASPPPTPPKDTIPSLSYRAEPMPPSAPSQTKHGEGPTAGLDVYRKTTFKLSDKVPTPTDG